MREFLYTVGNEKGLSARPCGLLCSTAKKYESECVISYKARKADCKNLNSVMQLRIPYGETLTLRVDGEDEKDAAGAILHCLSVYVG